MFGPILVLMLFAGSFAELPSGAVLRLGDHRFRAEGEVRHLRFNVGGATLTGWVVRPDGSLHPVAWSTVGGVPCANAPLHSPPETVEGTTPSVRLGGNRVLTAGPGNAGRVWDATTARQLAQLTGHVGRVTSVAGSADVKLLATASADGLVRVWDGETFRPLSEPRGHIAPVRTIRVSTDGTRAVTTGADGSARVWNLVTGRELRAFAVAGAVEFTPDGLGLVTPHGRSGSDTAIVRDILTGMEMIPDQPPPRPANTIGDWVAGHGVSLAVSPTGNMIAVALPDGTIALYEWATHGHRRTLVGHGSRCRAMVFTPDGSRLLTAAADHTVLVWDVRPQTMPLPVIVRRETNAAKLWAVMCVGSPETAYLAMARLAVEPGAAVATAQMRMKPAEAPETAAATRLADSRAVELLGSLGTPDAHEFLVEIARGDPTAWRTQEATRELSRIKPFRPR